MRVSDPSPASSSVTLTQQNIQIGPDICYGSQTSQVGRFTPNRHILWKNDTWLAYLKNHKVQEKSPQNSFLQ